MASTFIRARFGWVTHLLQKSREGPGTIDDRILSQTVGFIGGQLLNAPGNGNGDASKTSTQRCPDIGLLLASLTEGPALSRRRGCGCPIPQHVNTSISTGTRSPIMHCILRSRISLACSNQLPLGVYIEAHPVPALLRQEVGLRNSPPVVFAESLQSNQLNLLSRAPEVSV